MRKKSQVSTRSFHEAGLVNTLLDFLKVLEDMDKKGETTRNVSGEFDGPFGSRVVYNYIVTIGLEDTAMQAKRAGRKVKKAGGIGDGQ
jgi:hypothetical protein